LGGLVSALLLSTAASALMAGETATTRHPASAPSEYAMRVSADTDFIVVPLPTEATRLAGGDKDLARVGEAVRQAFASELNGVPLRIVEKTPFASAAEPSALVADQTHEQVVISLNKSVQYVYALLAVLDPGKEPLAQLTILREDGVPTRIKFLAGQNAAPSLGEWKGQLEPRSDVPGKVTVVLETKTADGTPVRLLLLQWRNDNEWYNVTDLKFKLLDSKAKTRLAVLGVTGANAKKK
jgi:hypothetical protein